MDKFQKAIVYVRQCLELAVDISGGAAVGILTIALTYSYFRGRDIGVGSAAAYATAIGAFAATVINGKGNDDGPKQA